jgi:hypothetical protein
VFIAQTIDGRTTTAGALLASWNGDRPIAAGLKQAESAARHASRKHAIRCAGPFSAAVGPAGLVKGAVQ